MNTNNLLVQLSNCKNYIALAKVIRPLLKSGDLVVSFNYHLNKVVFLHGDNLLEVTSDILNHHAGRIEYITREENEDPTSKNKYDILRVQTMASVLNNRGMSEFYNMIKDYLLKLDY